MAKEQGKIKPVVRMQSIIRRRPAVGRVRLGLLLVLAGVLSSPALGQGWATSPPPLSSDDPSGNKVRLLENVGIDQRLGEQVPLDLEFRDENGSAVRLGQYFGRKPVVLTLVYYSCPMLCNQVLNGLTSGLDVVSFDIGKEFDVVTVSFDPRETPELAKDKKRRAELSQA